ncbi:MAG: 16S rRNA (adenine(1518)-N(6)/adenine(1519)-N(6)) -dimethyltransferase RsmA [Bryobacter sp.]
MPRIFGQHFLRSKPVLEKIAAAVAPDGLETHIVEIGPGQGALTEYLLPLAERITAIEVDPAMVAALPAHEKLTVLHQDVLTADLRALAPFALAGNLPYYISSPIMAKVFEAVGAWNRAVFLVQLEVAQRMCSAPNSRDYGYLSVLTQVHCRAKLLFQVPPGAFAPPPKVKSAVILLEPKPVDGKALKPFLRFVSAAFQQKRKTLRNNLGVLFPKPLVEAQPEANLRAEQLSIEGLSELYQRLSQTAPNVILTD